MYNIMSLLKSMFKYGNPKCKHFYAPISPILEDDVFTGNSYITMLCDNWGREESYWSPDSVDWFQSKGHTAESVRK